MRIDTDPDTGAAYLHLRDSSGPVDRSVELVGDGDLTIIADYVDDTVVGLELLGAKLPAQGPVASPQRPRIGWGRST